MQEQQKTHPRHNNDAKKIPITNFNVGHVVDLSDCYNEIYMADICLNILLIQIMITEVTVILLEIISRNT